MADTDKDTGEDKDSDSDSDSNSVNSSSDVDDTSNSEDNAEDTLFDHGTDDGNALLQDRPEDHCETVVLPAAYTGDEPFGTLGMRPPVISADGTRRALVDHACAEDEGIWLTDVDMLDRLPSAAGDLGVELEIPDYAEDMPSVNRSDYADFPVHSIQGRDLSLVVEHAPFRAPTTFEGFRRPDIPQDDRDARVSPGMHVVLFGRTMDARTVCIILHGFYPWFHVNVPEFWKQSDLDAFGRVLCALGNPQGRDRMQLTLGTDIRVSFEYSASIYGWYSDRHDVRDRRKFKWVRIETSSQFLRKRLHDALTRAPPQDDTALAEAIPSMSADADLRASYRKQFQQLAHSAPLCTTQINGETPYLRRGTVHRCRVKDFGESTASTYEANPAHANRYDIRYLDSHSYTTLERSATPYFANEFAEPRVQFLYSADIAITSYVWFTRDQFTERRGVDCISTAQYEGVAPVDAISRHPQEGKVTLPAPLVYFCFDGEMIPQYDRFPESFLGDQTRVISVTIGRTDRSPEESVDVLLGVGSFGVTEEMHRDPKTIVRCYETVPQALHGFRRLLADVDADIVTGYNIFGFDCPFWSNEYVQHIIPQRLRGTEAMHAFFLYAFPRIYALYETLDRDAATVRAILAELPYTSRTFMHHTAFASTTDSHRGCGGGATVSGEPLDPPFGLAHYLYQGVARRCGVATAKQLQRHPTWTHAPTWAELVQDTVFRLWSTFLVAYPQWAGKRSSEAMLPPGPNAPPYKRVVHRLDKIVQDSCGPSVWTNVLLQNYGSPLRMPMVHAVFLRQLLRKLIEAKMDDLRQSLTPGTPAFKALSSAQRQQKQQRLGRLRARYTDARKHEYPGWHAVSRQYVPPLDPAAGKVPARDVQELSSDTWWHVVFPPALRDLYSQWIDTYTTKLEASPMIGQTTIDACFANRVLYNPEQPSTGLPFFAKGRYASSYQPHIQVKPKKSQGTGDIVLEMWRMHGRIQFDLLQWVRENQKLDGYSLKRVTEHYFGAGNQNMLKDDLGYREMFARIRHPDPRKRAAVLTYARQDARVCARLLEHNHIATNLTSLARLTNVRMCDIYNYGQQKRVLSQMTRRGYELGYVMTRGYSEYDVYFGDAKYKGACVVTPKPGVYPQPVMTLDFKSLYPTVMILLNLDFSNYVAPSRAARLYRRGLPLRVYPLEPKESKGKSYQDMREERMMARVMNAYFVDHHALRALDILERYELRRARSAWDAPDDTTCLDDGPEILPATTERAARRATQPHDDRYGDTAAQARHFRVEQERMAMCAEDTRAVPAAHRKLLRPNPDIDDLGVAYMCPGYLWCSREVLGGPLAQRLIRHVMHDPDKSFQGVTPVMLDEFLRQRNYVKKLKKQAAKAGNTAEKNVRDCEQLGIKQCANSQYGFMGSVSHPLACKSMAAAITAAGRYALQVLFDYLAVRYPDMRIVYGDTDSIMVYRTQYDQSVKEAFELGGRLGEELTRCCFGAPMELEFEKVYCPYLLTPKPKRYCAFKYEDSPDAYVVEHKGTPDVKRDRPLFIRRVYKALIDLIMENARTITAQQVFDLLKTYLDKLAENECTIEELQTSVSLNNNISAPTAGSKAWMRMKERQDPDTPQSGDRLAYAHVYQPQMYQRKSKSSLKISDYTESVSHIRRNGLPLNNRYYLQQLRKALEDVIISIDPRETSVVRLDADDPNTYTFRNALYAYIARCETRFQEKVDAEHIKPATSYSTKAPCTSRGVSLFTALEAQFITDDDDDDDDTVM